MSLLENYLKEGKITALSTDYKKDRCGLIVTEGNDFNLVEEFFSDQEGNVIDRVPITISFATKLRDILNSILQEQTFKTEEKKEKVSFKIVIDKETIKQLVELNENNNHVVWIKPETEMEISYDTPLNERKEQIVWFPKLMFEVYGSKLSIYYFVNKKKYYVLLPNIYENCSICMGDNKIREIKEFNTVKKFIEYHEDIFFNSPFNHFHYESTTITENLKGKNIWQIHEEVNALTNNLEKEKMLLQYLTKVK
jgi:hypothetical protein